jgi:multicomponent Na+:H+ antiporter subunit A
MTDTPAGTLATPRSTAAPMSLPARAGFVALPAAAFAVVLWLIGSFDLPLAGSLAWVPALGVEFAWRIDGLSALMLLMISGIGTAVFVYAGGYLAGDPQQGRLYVLLSLFMLAMVGCVVADNLVLLFVFWELTSLTSFLLVGFKHYQAGSRRSAQQAFLVTGTGGLFLLAGVILLGQLAGTFSISGVVERVAAMPQTPALTAALLLILVGCFTKSAQFPFHFWLPNAMSAPTPVSAYLHSATMVKLGVYLLARLDPAFGEWPLWEWLLKAVGSVTAAWGMVLALRERDLKRILAWSTVATLGTLVMLIGLRGEGATIAVGALLLAHGLYKAPLFFVAGNVDHGAGTRVIDRLGNLRHAMPFTAAAALLAGMSMAGIPTSFGYVVKDAIVGAKSATDVFAFAAAAYTVFGAIAVAVAGVAAIRIFWRHPGVNEACEAHEGGPALVIPPIALALTGILLGLFPFFAEDLVAGASVAMTPGTEAVVAGLALQVGPSLGSLAVSLAIGVAVYAFWDQLHGLFERAGARIGRVGMASQYERSLQWLPAQAARLTRALQHGRLPGYGAMVVGSVTAALIAALLAARGGLDWPAATLPSVAVAGACLLIVAGSLLATALRDRLVLLLAAGLVGYGSALLFLFTGAPDLAFTQFTVETVFVIVVASVLLKLRRLGRAASLDEPAFRPLAALLAVAFAAVITVLLLVATAGPMDSALADFFGSRAVPDAYGRNVVNVILVDFRALDTFGEIAVVLLSLLAALPLLERLRARARGGEERP